MSTEAVESVVSEWTAAGESSKDALARLKREGRHDEFQEAKREARKLWAKTQVELHGGAYREWYHSAHHKENRREVFLMALGQFPPLAAGELEASNPGVERDPFEHLAGLSDSVDLRRDAEWVYSNLAEYRRARDAKKTGQWKRIERGAPSRGAVQLLESAWINQQRFTQDVLPKLLVGKGEGSGESEDDRRQYGRVLELTGELLGGPVCSKCGGRLG